MAAQMIPITTSSQRSPLIVSIVFAIIPTTAVCLRLHARRYKRLPVKWDDYSIIVALVLLLGLIACDIVGVVLGGVGLHLMDVIKTYGPEPITIFMKDLVAIQILWATSLMFTKVSILLFYTRIFDVPRFRLAARITAVLVVLWCLSVILCGFLLCRPFAFNWDQTIPGGRCGNQILSYILTGAFNICTDVIVLCLPIPAIWNLQMRLSNKIGLIGIFAIGFFVCIVSAVRLVTLLNLTYTDITYSVPEALIWSMLEPAIGITLACLPIIRPLISHSFRTLSKGTASNKLSSGSHKNFQPMEEEYPLRPVEGKEAHIGGIGRSGGSAYGNHSQFGEMEQGRGVEGAGPLNGQKSDQGIVVTEEWTVKHSDFLRR